MRKLLIFTSRNSTNEFINYWKKPQPDIVFNGEDYIKDADWDFSKIDKLITTNDFLVFLHEGTEGKIGYHDTKDKRFSYKVFYYTTLDPKLRADALWSWGINPGIKFECDSPVLPFDLLCCALRENDPVKIEQAKTKIFKWYDEKAGIIKNQEQFLKYALCCMSKETIMANPSIINDHLILPKVQEQINYMQVNDYSDPESKYQDKFIQVCQILDGITPDN